MRDDQLRAVRMTAQSQNGINNECTGTRFAQIQCTNCTNAQMHKCPNA